MKRIEQLLAETGMSFNRALSGSIYIYVTSATENVEFYKKINHDDVQIDADCLDDCLNGYNDGIFTVRISDHDGFDGAGEVGVSVRVRPVASNRVGEGMVVSTSALRALGIECDDLVEWEK